MPVLVSKDDNFTAIFTDYSHLLKDEMKILIALMITFLSLFFKHLGKKAKNKYQPTNFEMLAIVQFDSYVHKTTRYGIYSHPQSGQVLVVFVGVFDI